MDGLVSLKIIKHCTEEGTGGDFVQVGIYIVVYYNY